ncbi:MAG: 16S rRNA (cytosine(1402)-N(4))-methyltransferase RsmH [Pseudohongiellaceae bacterium]
MTVAQGHETVLLEPAASALVTNPNGRYVDATFGRGGHSRRILESLGGNGQLLGIDRDPVAVVEGRKLAERESRFTMVYGSFSDLRQHVTDVWPDASGTLDGILLDLGVSSPQLDDATRGFSFMQDGPLDMRMDPDSGESAAQWLTRADEKDIADVIYQYGEERHSRRIARAIVRAREEAPIERTAQLAEIVKTAHPSWERHKHPATRTFQAIRIHVNGELDALQTVLEQSLDLLRADGCLCVISFHSLEDRLIKQFMRREYQGPRLPKGVPVQYEQTVGRLQKPEKAIRPDREEVERNPRARSSTLRVARLAVQQMEQTDGAS